MGSRRARLRVATGALAGLLAGGSAALFAPAPALAAHLGRPTPIRLSLTATAQPAAVQTVGTPVDYAFAVRNDAATTATGLRVRVALRASAAVPLSGVRCAATTLAPADTTTCTVRYTVNQADLNRGSIVNSAVATATDAAQAPIGSAPVTSTVHVDRAASLAVVQSVAPTTVSAVGDVARFSAVVTNTGNVTVHGVRAADVLSSAPSRPVRLACSFATLAPADSTTCTAEYTTTQRDFDAGSVTATATAVAAPPSGPAVRSASSTATLTARQRAALGLTMTAAVTDLNGNGVADLADTIRWTYVVRNTGTITLAGVSVTDPVAGAVVCAAHRLAAGATAVCTGAHPWLISQADVDAGRVDTTATATGRAADIGTTVESAQATTSTQVGTRPALELLSAGILQDDGDGRIGAGDRIRWAYSVTNTGNVTLDHLAIHAADGTVGTCPVGALPPGGSTTCSGATPHVLTVADVRSGRVATIAVATADVRGVEVTSLASTALVTLPHSAGLQVLLTATNVHASASGAGDTVRWQAVVTNVGNVTLHGLLVADGRGHPMSCPTTVIAPLARATCSTGARAVTAAQAAAGRVTVVVRAAATTPTGSRITSLPATASAELAAPADSAVAPLPVLPSGATGVGGPNGAGGTGGLAATGASEVPSLLQLALWSILLGIVLLVGGRFAGGPRRARPGCADPPAG